MPALPMAPEWSRTLLFVVALAVSGCATVLNQGPDQVHLQTDPNGAEVILDGRRVGTTPVDLELDASRRYQLLFAKPGYRDFGLDLVGEVQALWVVLDIFMGIWPLAVDAATGRWKGFDEVQSVRLKDSSPDDWTEAQASGDIDAFEEFLRLHPSSAFSDSARALVAGLSLEAAWSAARESDGIPNYEEFLRNHAESEYADQAEVRLGELRLERDWRSTQSTDEIEAYEAFLTEYPASEFSAEARLRCDQLTLARDWATAQATNRIAGYLAFLEEHSSSEYAEEARGQLRLLESRGPEIADLLRDEEIEAEVVGSSIQAVRIRLRRRGSRTVRVRVPVGTYFVAHNASAQNMVSTKEIVRRLTSNEWVNVQVDAACANRIKNIPGTNDSFDIRSSPHQEDLAKLMPVLARAGSGYSTRQAAVWIVTDNADFDDLGILRSGFGGYGPRVIGAAAAAAAMRACEEAGINLPGRAIWRDRAEILDALEGGELKTWLESRSRGEGG